MIRSASAAESVFAIFGIGDQPTYLEGKMHSQARFRVIQVEAADLPDAFHAIQQRVAMDVQLIGSLAKVAVFLEERFQRDDEFFVDVAIIGQFAESLAVEAAQF